MGKVNNINQSEPNYWQKQYKNNPPWDIGRPQKVFKRLAEEIKVKSKILDIGCGTGENALVFAKLGFETIGIDYVKDAIDEAVRKAEEREIVAQFFVLNAFKLERLNQKFNIIIDSGLFHIFNDLERLKFRESLSKVISIKGIYYLLCFSNLEPPGFGPRRINKEEIHSTFDNHWNVLSIEPAIFESNFGRSKAWFAKIQYLG